MRWRDPEFRRNLLVLGSWKDKRVRRRLIAVAFTMLLLVVLGFYWTGRPLATDPSLCGQLCHATYGEYQSWSRSSHSEVPCHLCHLDTPMQKLVNPIARLIKVRVGSFDKPLNADSEYSQKHIAKERCLRCHAKNAPKLTAKPAPRPEGPMHETHLAMNMDCTICHNRIAHRGAEKYEPVRSWAPDFKYKDFLTMREGCWRCHSLDGQWRDEKTLELVAGKKPPTECNACHESIWTLKPREGLIDHRDVKGIAWRSGDRHGKEAQKDFFVCLGCHDRNKRPDGSKNPPNCSDACHGGMVMPHNTPAWSKYYPVSASADTGVPEWIQVHSKEAADRGVRRAVDGRTLDPNKACSICHGRRSKTDNFCDDCHHSEILDKVTDKVAKEIMSAGNRWRKQHPKAVKRLGTVKCIRCHALEFCTDCHTGGI